MGPPLLEGWGLVVTACLVDLLLLLALRIGPGFDRPRLVISHMVYFSLATFALFGLDKLLARVRRRRVAERNLLALSFLGGALGGLLGIVVFRHKSRGLAFRILVPVALIINACFILAIFLGG